MKNFGQIILYGSLALHTRNYFLCEAGKFPFIQINDILHKLYQQNISQEVLKLRGFSFS